MRLTIFTCFLSLLPFFCQAKPEESPCGELHEEYMEYISFEKSCRYPDGIVFSFTDATRKMCRCKEPYLRYFGRCYLKEECPDLCDYTTEEIVACASSTERTCKDPDPAFWAEDCQVNACRCKEGHLRNHDNLCVLAADCNKYGNSN